MLVHPADVYVGVKQERAFVKAGEPLAVEIKIPPRDRALSVNVKPRDAKLDPGGRTEVDIDVRDAAGAAVAGGSVAAGTAPSRAARSSLMRSTCGSASASLLAHRKAGRWRSTFGRGAGDRLIVE